MKRTILILTCTAFLFLVLPGAVGAFYYDLGTDSYVNLSDTNDNLKLLSLVNSNIGSYSFNLKPGQSQTFWYGTFATKETWINPDDQRVSRLEAQLDFGDFKVKIPGQSFGFSAPFQAPSASIEPVAGSMLGLLDSVPPGGVSPHQIVNSVDWSVVTEVRCVKRLALNLLNRYAVNGVIPQSKVAELRAILSNPGSIDPEGFAQGYFVTWNDQIPMLPDGTPDYGATGWIKIDESPVDVYFGPNDSGHFQVDFSDVFLTGLYWLGPDWNGLPVMATITHLADPVPEPGTLVMLGMGLMGLAGAGWKSRGKRGA